MGERGNVQGPRKMSCMKPVPSLEPIPTEELCLYRTCVYVLVTQSCPTLCDPMDCSLPGSSVHGILQTRILEWVAISCLVQNIVQSYPRGAWALGYFASNYHQPWLLGAFILQLFILFSSPWTKLASGASLTASLQGLTALKQLILTLDSRTLERSFSRSKIYGCGG